LQCSIDPSTVAGNTIGVIGRKEEAVYIAAQACDSQMILIIINEENQCSWHLSVLGRILSLLKSIS
jgi:hypothetical protein